METRITHVTLHHWNSIVDCKCNCRDSIVEPLLAANYKALPSYLAIRYCYIVGKFYNHNYNISKKIDLLEKSNTWFDRAFMVSQSSRTVITSPKLYFKRAHTKYVLSNVVSNEEDALCLLETASSLVDASLKKFPGNSSIALLRKEIDSNFNF